MKKTPALILLFFAIFYPLFADDDIHYEIQVGSYSDITNAVSAVNILRDGGFTPYWDLHQNLTRVRIPNIRVDELPETLNRVRVLGFSNPWVIEPAASPEPLHRVQAGAYRERSNAEDAFNRLENAGLNPSYENLTGLTRVVVAGINERDLDDVVQLIHLAGFSDVWVREDSGTPSASPSVFTVMVNAGAVTEITPTGSTEPLRIVQTIPSFREAESPDNTYQADAPVIFFFSEAIYLGSLEDNIVITADGIPVDGTIVINESAGGYAILTFTPAEALPDGAVVEITMRQGLMDGGGNPMAMDLNLSYITEEGSQTIFRRDNFGFEAGNDGVIFSGDGAISPARGSLLPYEGNYYAAISTGTRIVSPSGIAIGLRSSQIQLGPIMEPFTSLGFYYDFISAEFNDYVDSEFDDTAIITIYGPYGVYNEVITSVNIVRYENSRFSAYPNMPDDGDEYAGHTGWQFFRIENIDAGTPAFIIFTISDVGDDHLTSILAVDSIELE